MTAPSKAAPGLCILYAFAAALLTLPIVAYLIVLATTGLHPGALALALVLVSPALAAATGLGLVALGAWRDGASAVTSMRLAEACGLGFGVIGCALGLWLLERAEQSAARGGGLLGGLGIVPLAAGVALLVLAAASWLLRNGFRK